MSKHFHITGSFEGHLDCKRVYVEGDHDVQLHFNCPNCNHSWHEDYNGDRVSYPRLNAPSEFYCYCRECDHEWQEEITVHFNVTTGDKGAEYYEEEKIINGLDSIIEDFNKRFLEWERKSGCQANFAWRYRGCSKILVKSDVSKSLYKEEPSEETISDAINTMQSTEPSKISKS